MADEAEVVDVSSKDVIAYDQALFPKLVDQDPREVQARFATRFSQAKTVQDLFNVLQGNSSKDMIGRRVEILGVAWAPYESEQGIIPNAICDAVDIDTGEKIEFATTSMMLTQFIRQAELIKALPVKVRIVAKKTRNNQTALNFEPV